MMSREILFRAWDKERNVMEHNVQRCYDGLGKDGHSCDAFGQYFLDDNWYTEDGDSKDEIRYEVMQYTGLKDKNGVKIFEGDIISSPHFRDAAGRSHILKHIVKWSDKYHGWFLLSAHSMDEKDGSIQMFVAEQGEMEVIGNIHENPELLE